MLAHASSQLVVQSTWTQLVKQLLSLITNKYVIMPHADMTKNAAHS